MKDVSVLYISNFNLNRDSGKDRATQQKLRCLAEKVEIFKLITNNSDSFYIKVALFFILDIKALIYIARYKPDWVISRGYCAPLSLRFARFLHLKTIREVHAYGIEEVEFSQGKGIKRQLARIIARKSLKIDVASDLRIFNHPDLLNWYRAQGFANNVDFFVYNGFCPDGKSDLSRERARRKFNIGKQERVLVFSGSATSWHGVEYLVRLQESFNKHGDEIRIAFGGGNVSKFDPESICTNFTPLSSSECADLVRAADFCLLPVNNCRISPGSPLKLYDYILNERYVLAQSNTNGYSDEVSMWRVGLSVDFTDTENARKSILEAFGMHFPEEYPRCNVSWSDRIDSWIEGIVASDDV